jgi:predicted  nucleic acid-binding Zn-ribbon protein
MSSIFLSPSAQGQLSALKAANAIPLQRLDARRAGFERQNQALDGIQAEAAQLRRSIDELASNPSAGRAEVATFVREFNELFERLGSATARGAVLGMSSELRFARRDLRAPLANVEVLAALREAGVATTRTGLSVVAEPAVGFSAQAVASAVRSALERVEASTQAAERRVQGFIGRIGAERERAQAQVQRANARTEAMFFRMYEAMQRMAAGNAGASSTSIFA